MCFRGGYIKKLKFLFFKVGNGKVVFKIEEKIKVLRMLFRNIEVNFRKNFENGCFYKIRIKGKNE